MEVCISGNTSTPQNIGGFGKSINPPTSAGPVPGDISMTDLKNCLTDIINVENVEKSTSRWAPSVNKNDMGQDVSRAKQMHSSQSDCSNLVMGKHLNKCATFPQPGEHKAVTGEALNQKENRESSGWKSLGKSVDQTYSRSLSLPTPSKLVSAMKGSREKQGMPPKKLSVTWSPDVYDPVPTSVSHVFSNKNQHKKRGKNKQKGGGRSSRSSKGKDKKQARKNGGSANSSMLLDNGKSLVGSGDPKLGALDFDSESPDQFCGSSFLKTSVMEMHFPVAEAK